MKLVDSNKENWKEINKIVLIVNAVDFDYSEKLAINLNCNFENISKGRCRVRINEKKKVCKFIISSIKSSTNDGKYFL